MAERPEIDEKHPQPLCLDKAYDSQKCRQNLRQQNYTPHIRSRGEEKQELAASAPKTAPSGLNQLVHGLAIPGARNDG